MPGPEPLELDQDLGYLRLSWRLQRWLWAALALLVLIALTGAFGGGVLAHARQGPLEYERIVRYAAPSRLTIEAQSDSPLGVRISREFVAGVDIQRITPPPESVAVTGPSLQYRFRAADGAPVRIDIDFVPRRCGLQKASIEVDGQSPRRIAQFVFP